MINLKNRFQEAGIKKYRTYSADLTIFEAKHPTNNISYDLIIADVPCTGSGTWGRNPDSIYFFDIREIERYQALQKKILTNIIPVLKEGGTLIYITCSVFKKENEEVVQFIQQKFNLRMEKMALLKGFDQRADSFFVARFIA
jgi:16S rRNA (cytosine967-C5)-methyltransferase